MTRVSEKGTSTEQRHINIRSEQEGFCEKDMYINLNYLRSHLNLIQISASLHFRFLFDETHLRKLLPGRKCTWYILYCTRSYSEPGSSVSIVSGYGLDNQEIQVRSPAEAKGFFL
jgi:hypothetical protein